MNRRDITIVELSLTLSISDKEGVAIIMCEAELKQKYEALAQGRTLLESSLHLNLAEHINSEIGLGTIRDVQSAKDWLHNSFLFQRIQQNPRHYAIGKAGEQTWQERVDELVTRSIEDLKKDQLVEEGDDRDGLKSTEYGDIMSKVSKKSRLTWTNITFSFRSITYANPQ